MSQMCPPTTTNSLPRKSILKRPSDGSSTRKKSVIFDHVSLREYPLILGDNPSVSEGAPLSIGWEHVGEQVEDLDFYEYCKAKDGAERSSRKKMVMSVRRRASMLLSAGYSLEDIAMATIAVEETKRQRADSLKGSGWSNPMMLLNGAVETTGMALKRVDVLGVGAAAGKLGGVVVGAGTAIGGATDKAVRKSVKASKNGVTTVVGVGADITTATGKLLINSVQGSSRAVTGAAVKAGSIVTAPVVGGAKLMKRTGKRVSDIVTGKNSSSVKDVAPTTSATSSS